MGGLLNPHTFHTIYDDKGNRHENITDWALEKFREHYMAETRPLVSVSNSTDSNDEANTLLDSRVSAIKKEDTLHYVYAVLHNPAYRTKYELNLKRDFPRIPLYDDFNKWVNWGKALMNLHIGYEAVEEFS